MFCKAFFSFFGIVLCLLGGLRFTEPSFAQVALPDPAKTSPVNVRNIAVVDLDGVLRAADANNRVRELLDGQRSKFQEEFRAVEIDLQQSEKDLISKREIMAKEEYEKLVTTFQVRVSGVQKEIQYKRQSIDSAYQKALGKIRSLAIEEITKIASEREIDLILNRNSTVIFLPNLNISDEVLKRLNERTKNARIEVESKEPIKE